MKDFHHLMAKDIFGCLTSQEQEELNLLLQQKRISNAQYQEMKRLSVGRELHENIRKIRHSSKRINNFLRYAAIFILPLSIGGYFLFHNLSFDTQSSVPALSSTLNQKPERKQPELTLSTGEVIKLKRDENQEFVAPHILNTGKTLEYQTSKTSQPQYNTIQYNTITVPAAGEFNIKLADGTQVWLNENTELKYPQEFTNDTREIYLKTGEVYLEVTKDPQHPFIVHTPNGKVEVLGTHFNIHCYNSKQVETTLAEGSVKITNEENEEIILKPGQQALVTKQIKVTEVDIEEIISWKDNLFYFKDISLEVILEKLSGWYDFEVFWINPELKTTQYFMCIDKYASVNEILNKLSETGDIRFNIQGKAVSVSK